LTLELLIGLHGVVCHILEFLVGYVLHSDLTRGRIFSNRFYIRFAELTGVIGGMWVISGITEIVVVSATTATDVIGDYCVVKSRVVIIGGVEHLILITVIVVKDCGILLV